MTQTKEQLEKWYLVDHLTMDVIGVMLGVTRQSVCGYIKKARIDTSTAGRFDVPCTHCGKIHSTTRKKWRVQFRSFCSTTCYYAARREPKYRRWRQGQRIARIVMSEHLHRPVRGNEVIHHIDFNNHNNDISNLMLFGSHGEHITYHHKINRGEDYPPIAQANQPGRKENGL